MDVVIQEASPPHPSTTPYAHHPGILNTKCKGCGQIRPRIIRHLQQSRFKINACMNYYTAAEIAIHKKIHKTLENMKLKEKDKERTRINKARHTKNIFRKTCKGLFAFKHVSGCVLLSSLESRSKCKQCKDPRLEIICRVCNVLVIIPH